MKLLKGIISTIMLLVTFVSLQSCAVASLPVEQINFSKKSEKGMLMGSVTFPTDKPRFQGYFFRLNEKATQEFQIDRSDLGQLDSGKTYLFLIERPVGVSEISSVRLFHNSGFVAAQYDNQIGGFTIPYEIKKGEITYIGNITLNDYSKKGEVAVGYNNKFERDLEELKKLQPSIDWSTVKNDETRKIEYNSK